MCHKRKLHECHLLNIQLLNVILEVTKINEMDQHLRQNLPHMSFGLENCRLCMKIVAWLVALRRK